MPRLSLAFKALRELGPRQLGLYAWYRLGLRSGFLSWQTKDDGRRTADRRRQTVDGGRALILHPLLNLPGREELVAVLSEGGSLLLHEADEIVGGRVRLFGGEPAPLRLEVPGKLAHWTEYEQGSGEIKLRGGAGGRRDNTSLGSGGAEQGDVKFIWELGRFGWAYTLGRAYWLSGDERYAEAFWKYVEIFLEANPPNLGPHWASGQEAALRLIAFVFAAQVFSESECSTEHRKARLAGAVAAHAARIPPTLAYARAQNNNHLLTEAVGLYTAGAALPDYPRSAQWRKLGWRWLNHALLSQIDADGGYIQHSTNYHRLALQVALWARRAAQSQGQRLPEEICLRLAAAARWLLALHDPGSGRVPNLGPNDGAYIQPFTVCPFSDYRPVLQAASLAFLGERAFPSGPWDEMSLWLRDEGTELNLQASKVDPQPFPPLVLRLSKNGSWGYFRVARFHDRPGHADQLHLDLWWRGLNIAQDAGTYLYNAAPPWENALARTALHNTVTVNGADQMTRAGRFLWLDWAQGQILSQESAGDGEWARCAAQHDGYRQLGVIHRREVAAYKDGRWMVADQLSPVKNVPSEPSIILSQPVNARLHWLLPDWPFQIEIGQFRLELQVESPQGLIRLLMGCDPQEPISNLNSPLNYQVVRAGELLQGDGPVSPTWGWASPTYGVKIPALSVAITVVQPLPLSLSSEWIFP